MADWKQPSMDNLVVAVFGRRGEADAGSRILRDLDAAGSIDLFATSVIATDDGGAATVHDAPDEGPLGAAVRLFTDRLVLALADPPQHLARPGGGADLVDAVKRRLRPGWSVLVAELWEQWVQPVDARLLAQAAVVLRRPREDVSPADLERERTGISGARAALAAANAEFEAKMAYVMAKLAVARGPLKGRLDARISERLAQHRHRTMALMRAVI